VRFRRIDWVIESPYPHDSALLPAVHRELGVPLTAHYLREQTGLHPWTSNMRTGYDSRIMAHPIDRELLRRLSRQQDALLITNCWHDPTVQLAVLGLIAARRPYVVLNDALDESKHRPVLKRVARALFLRLLFRHASAVLATSTPAVEAFAALGCPADRISLFPLCIDTGRFPFLPATKQPQLVFGSCARLDHRKGMDLALRALAAAFGDDHQSFEYRIAGDGPFRSRLESLATTLGIRDNVTFLGWQDPAALPAFYQGLHYLLHPSWFESYGIVVVEAMSSGAVVVASSATAVARDVIIPDQSGFLHPAGDLARLTTIIRSLRESPDEQRLRLAQSARVFAEQRTATRAARRLGEILAR
jgi:glycosyltransferase involved in cell wall biosynthesis